MKLVNFEWKKVVVALLIVGMIVTMKKPVVAFSQGGILVVIDPGHSSGYNQGCVSGYTEGDWSMEQALEDKAALEACGFSVILTRDREGNPGLYERGQMAVQNSAGYDAVVFMSNHTNAYGDTQNPNASGVSAITSAYLSEKNTQLINTVMKAVADEMNQVTGVTDVKGIEVCQNFNGEDYYGVIRGSVSGARSLREAGAIYIYFRTWVSYKPGRVFLSF